MMRVIRDVRSYFIDIVYYKKIFSLSCKKREKNEICYNKDKMK
jgi:hypothetical protein